MAPENSNTPPGAADKRATDPNSEAETKKIPVLSPEDMKKNVLVGVCGVQASGKTVFLAAIFHAMNGTLIDGLGRVSFDRTKGAGYFEQMENSIRARDSAPPTHDSAFARLVVETDRADGNGKSETGIVLFDFAGGHFTAFADIEAAITDAPDKETKADLAHVRDYLEKCDAFILLIDSTKFRQDDKPSETSPFSPSVIFIIDHCEKHFKPIALVFSKSDLNRDLTLEKVLKFPRVNDFVNRFRSNASQIDKPFGMVAVLSCYELDDDVSGRVRQQADGTIWRPEPKWVFSEIVKVIWPKAMARLQQAIDERKAAEEAVREGERKAVKAKRLKLGLAAGAVVMLAAAPLVVSRVRHYQEWRADIGTVTQAADMLRQHQPQRIAGDRQDAFRRLQNDRGGAEGEAAWSEFEAAYRESLRKIPAPVYTGGDQLRATETLLNLGAFVAPPDNEIIDLLRLHQNLLSAAGNCKPPNSEARRTLVGKVPAKAGGPRDAFLKALISEGDNLRAACADEVAAAGNNQTTLKSAVLFVRDQLLADRRQQSLDPRWRTALKRSYAKFMGASLAGLLTRAKVVEFLQTAIPGLKTLLAAANKNAVEVVKYSYIWDAIGKLELVDLDALRSRLDSLPEGLTSYEGETTTDETKKRTLEYLEYTLQELFRFERGEVEDRENLWLKLFEGADSEYLFDLHAPDAWPPSQIPWKDRLRTDLKSANYSKEETQRVIGEISKRPLYWWEVGGILTRADNRYLELKSVQSYKDAVQQLGDGNSEPNMRASGPIRKIATLANLLHEEWVSYLGVDSPMLRRHRDDAAALASRLESTRSDAGPLLRRYCESHLSQYGVKCAN